MISGVLTKLSADRLLDESGDFPYYEGEIKLLEEDLHFYRAWPSFRACQQRC